MQRWRMTSDSLGIWAEVTLDEAQGAATFCGQAIDVSEAKRIIAGYVTARFTGATHPIARLEEIEEEE